MIIVRKVFLQQKNYKTMNKIIMEIEDGILFVLRRVTFLEGSKRRFATLGCYCAGSRFFAGNIDLDVNWEIDCPNAFICWGEYAAVCFRDSFTVVRCL